MKRSLAAGLITGVFVLTGTARAQPAPPFFGGGGTAFDPEVGVVQSGALLDATATVSHDRRYVTITTGATNTRLRDLVLFPVSAIGFVGGVNPGGGGAPGGGGGGGALGAAAVNAGINTSPTAIANQNSILNREGMFLLATLE